MRHCLNDAATILNMDLPMSSSGYTLFFVTLRPGFEPRENIQILTRGQGIHGATCASIPTQTQYQNNICYYFLKQEQSGISLRDSGATFPRFIVREAARLGENTSQKSTWNTLQSDMTKMYFISHSRTRGEVFKLVLS